MSSVTAESSEVFGRWVSYSPSIHTAYVPLVDEPFLVRLQTRTGARTLSKLLGDFPNLFSVR